MLFSLSISSFLLSVWPYKIDETENLPEHQQPSSKHSRAAAPERGVWILNIKGPVRRSQTNHMSRTTAALDGWARACLINISMSDWSWSSKHDDSLALWFCFIPSARLVLLLLLMSSAIWCEYEIRNGRFFPFLPSTQWLRFGCCHRWGGREWVKKAKYPKSISRTISLRFVGGDREEASRRRDH